MNCLPDARIRAVSALGLVMILSLAGCATKSESSEAYEKGFRLATVYRIAAGDQLAVPALHDCRKGSNAQASIDRPFVAYRYRGAGAFPWRYAVHPVVESLNLREGERVVINVKDCASVPKRSDTRFVARREPSRDLLNETGSPGPNIRRCGLTRPRKLHRPRAPYSNPLKAVTREGVRNFVCEA